MDMSINLHLRNMLVKLEEITKCAVCHGGVGTSVLQCTAGHGVCSCCRQQITRCALCKEPFLGCKPTMLVQILEALPRLCLYKDEGCNDISFANEHEMICGFRPLRCKLGKFNECKWVGKAKDFKNHARVHHNSFFTSYTTGGLQKLYYKSFKDNWHTQHYLHVVDNNMFLLFAHKDQTLKRFVQLVKHIPVGQLCESYYFTLTLSKQNFIFKHSIRASTLLNSNEHLKDNPNCMIVPIDQLDSFVNTSTGSLEVTFEAFKK